MVLKTPKVLMRILLSIAVLLFQCAAIRGQETSETRLFLSQVSKDWDKGDTVYYAPKLDIDESRFELLFELLSRDRILVIAADLGRKFIISDTIILSCEEKAEIADKLLRLKNKRWPEGLFEKSKLVTWPAYAESTEIYLTDKASIKINTFSEPIFLRSNTLCLFYHHYFYPRYKKDRVFEDGRGLCAYKKVNGKWEALTWIGM